MKISAAYYLVLLNLLGADASSDFKVQLERGKHSVSASQHTEAIRQKKRALKKAAKNMENNDDLQKMKNHDIHRDSAPEGVKNLGLHKEPLYKRVLDYLNPLQAGSPYSSEKKMGHMSLGDKSQDTANHGNYKLFENAQNNFMSMEHKKNGIHPKVAGDTYVDITNYMNLQYTGPVNMGSEGKVLDVIYDTGSDWLVLDTDFCDNCHDPVYDTRSSTDYRRVSRDLMSQEYGSASILGYNATDSISVNDASLEDFPWFALTEQIGIEESFDGILGFSRQSTDYWWQNGPLLVEQLKVFDQITEETISFLLAGEQYNSFCDYGAYDIDMVKDNDEDNITWVAMPKQEFFWESAAVEGMKIGTGDRYRGQTSEYSYSGYEYSAIYDTGTSLVYAPAGLGYELLTRLTKGLDKYYDNSSGFMYVSCSQKRYYQDLYLTIDGYKFQISVEDYWYEFAAETTGGDNTCILGFIDDDYSDYWLLGDVFLRGYYTIHDNDDHKNAKIGFAPHWVSDKENVEKVDLTGTGVDDVAYECTPVYNYWPSGYSESQMRYWAAIWGGMFGC